MARMHSINFAMILFVIVTTTSVLNVMCNDVISVDLNTVTWEERKLYVPSLRRLASALKTGLSKNYADVTVDVEDCPNLRKPPFYMATKGLTGSQTLLDVGGDSYLLPRPNFTRIYDIVEIAQKALPDAKTISITGPGAGPFMVTKRNCEGIYNLQVNENNGYRSIIGESHVECVLDDGSCDLLKIPSNETRFPFLAQLYLSEGREGQVVHVKTKKRIGQQGNFITNCRDAVQAVFGNKTVGVGGVFILRNGSAIQHVMPNFSNKPVEDALKWVKFYTMPGPLIAVGTFVTNSMNGYFRLEHFHSFSQSKWGGHYYNDTTPDTIEYEAFFNVGHRIIRIDRPVVKNEQDCCL